MPPNTSGAVVLGQRDHMSLNWQQKAWRFYSPPDGTTVSSLRMNQGAIGEVRFVMGWIAQQVARVGWFVKLDGKQQTAEQAAELIAQVANEESTIIITTNLIVAGELNYLALAPEQIKEIVGPEVWETTVGATLPGDADKQWVAVSVVDDKRREYFEAARSGLNIRGIWPHPAKPTAVDPPLRSVIDVLEEIEQLQDLAYSQNRSRIANMGILTIANELELTNGLVNGATPTGSMIEAVINAPIADPRKASAAPIIFRAPMEFMTGALSNGARAVQWTKPDLEEYSMSLESRMKYAIQRLAYGFPLAPEILLGMQSTNRAVAFQVEESTYRAHIEPIADLVGRIYARALKLLLDRDVDVEVLPDATDLLARRHSIADAKDLYDRGLVGAPYVRRVAGVSEEDAATQEDLDRIVLLRKGTPHGPGREMDPSEVAGNEPVRADGGVIDVDASIELAAALESAIHMAQTAAISRLGASVRTRLGRIPSTPALELDPEAVPNQRLPSFLGVDRLAELNIDMNAAIGPASEWLVDWFEERVLTERVREGQATYDQVLNAATALRSYFYDLCCTTACSWPIARVPPDAVRELLQDLVPAEPANTEGG